MSRALVDIVDAAFDAGRRHDRQQLEILKTETMAAASKIASDTVEDPPDPESGYSPGKQEECIKYLKSLGYSVELMGDCRVKITSIPGMKDGETDGQD